MPDTHVLWRFSKTDAENYTVGRAAFSRLGGSGTGW
jgi:hypothetical protein